MKPLIKVFVFVLLGATLVNLSCQKELSCEDCASSTLSINKPPIAHAGIDKVIVLPTDSALLDGSASNDPDGTITNWLWTKISGPASLMIINTASAKTIVKDLSVGVYKFELKVTDNGNLSAKDTIQILVDDPAINQPPLANAGPDQIITFPANAVTLDGTGSIDPENNITNYSWTKISGPTSYNITNSNAVQTQVTNLVEGVYQFELKVTDAGVLFSKDTVQIQVTVAGICDNRPLIYASLIPIGSLSAGRYQIKSATAGNKIIFAGGYPAGVVYWNDPVPVDIYDISSNTWSLHFLLPEHPWLSHFRFGASITSLGNKIFIAGGGDAIGDNQTSKVDIYDASANTWSIEHLSTPRAELVAATVGNKVLFAGGWGFPSGPVFGWFNLVDVYDNATNTWTTATLSEARSDLSATTAANKIYFAGGWKNSSASDVIDIFDPSTNSWSVSNLLEPKANLGSIAAGNKIIWAGGSYPTSGTNWAYINHVEIRDLNTGSSSSTCIIPGADYNVVRKADNLVFFPGNKSPLDPEFGSYFEIYNITTNTWSRGVLNQRIIDATVISVNNTIYVAGGRNGTGTVYDKLWKLEF